jgi:hypothetical protein
MTVLVRKNDARLTHFHGPQGDHETNGNFFVGLALGRIAKVVELLRISNGYVQIREDQIVIIADFTLGFCNCGSDDEFVTNKLDFGRFDIRGLIFYQ